MRLSSTLFLLCLSGCCKCPEAPAPIRPPDTYDFYCPTPECNTHVTQAVSLHTVTNWAEKILHGTNYHIHVTLPCPHCHTTNVFASEILIQEPFAMHELPVRLPRKPVQPDIPPPLPLPSTNRP